MRADTAVDPADGRLDKDDKVPLYTQLNDLLREQIESGQLPANTKLPSERELCHTYQISRVTVRQALAQLQYEGLIHSIPGKGSYVAEPPLREELQPLSSFSEDARRRGMVASSLILAQETIAADRGLAERLRIRPGMAVFHLKRLRLMDGVPIAIQAAWLPRHLCPGLLHFNLAERSLYDVLRSEYELQMVRGDTTLRAALARPEEEDLLDLSGPVALLIGDQVTYLDDGTVIEFVHSVYRGDRYTLHVTM